MNETPEEIRARIDRTRAEVSGDVDALAEKVSPSSMVDRQTTRAKAALGDVKDKLFGSDDNHGSGAIGRVGDNVQGAVGQVGDSVHHATDSVARKAKGNPLAVGLIAFGVGALIASLIPASDQEKQAAAKVKESAQPLVDEAKDVAKEAGEHLKEPAQDAAQSLKETATAAGQNIKGEAQGAADDVRSDAQDAQQRVQDQAKH
ncbi:DUF3618 domain-containing protein [Agrococcus sp. Marseille-P2731]|uniref:DUF3618 domain-containing protein n=1 Tax=Agrococcus sp. Marseille-P2731 TaxID=1841862 RepID=UPI0009303F1E|nr:DUF3618 domain-containing protein [Agrococcus sp. Marseille-P2731]